MVSPQVVKRSYYTVVTANPYFDCALTFTPSMLWVVENVSQITLNVTGTVDISTNPTRTSSSIGFNPNTLRYGLYKLTFVVNLTFTDTTTRQVITRSSSTSSYLQITYTGLNVYYYGQTDLMIGSTQTIAMDAVNLSQDPDSYANLTRLSFKFSCMVYNMTSQQVVSTLNDDLWAVYQNESNRINDTCFSAGPTGFTLAEMISFDASHNFMTIQPRALGFRGVDIQYRINVSVMYAATLYSRLVTVNVSADQFSIWNDLK